MRRNLAILFVTALLLSLAAVSVNAQQTAPTVELHGYMLNRFYANQCYSARFVTERVSLSAVGHLANDTIAYAEVYFHPWQTDRTFANPFGNTATAEQGRTYLESAYVDTPFANGRLRFGKGRQLNFGLTPTYPNRKTTQYGILSETFTQDRIIGAQYDYKIGNFDIGSSLYTDLQVETRKIGDFSGATSTSVPPSTGAPIPANALVTTVQHLCDRDDNANGSGRLAGSLRFGVTKPNYQYHFSGAIGELTQADANFIAQQYLLSSTTNKSHNKYGFDGSISSGPWVFQTEAYQGNFSFVKISGYSVLAGYQPKNKMRYYVRWAALNNNQTPTVYQTTWNTQQLTIGVVKPISNGVWIEVNYESNLESPPPGQLDKKNNMLFMEFFTGF